MRLEIIEQHSRINLRQKSSSIDVLKRLEIWEAGETYFDGERDYGYGGYNYDGRWVGFVEKLTSAYLLGPKSSLLDVGCAKGFLVHDFNNSSEVGNAVGVDISLYALLSGVRSGMHGTFLCCNSTSLPFLDNEFELAICKDTLHNILCEEEIIESLIELKRVSKKTWIRVASYNTDNQRGVIRDWATFARSYYSTVKWHRIFKLAGYDRDYDWFHPSEYIEDVK